jgi:hypothetical protein
MSQRAVPADVSRVSSVAANLNGSDPIPHSRRLARLVLLPSLDTATLRLEAALGPELARFLVSALCADGHGRLGSSSP